MTLERNNLTKAQTMTVAAIEEQLPDLVEARDVVESFHEMLRRKSKDDLDTWIDRAAASLSPHSRTVSSATGQPSKMR
ncbi:transposase [Ochrobactrum oryzae]|nr:transposase [Brucella oryzae]